MNIKSIKNFIVLGAIVLLVAGAQSASAYAPYVPWEQSVQPPVGYSYYPAPDVRPLVSSSGTVHEPSNGGVVQTGNAQAPKTTSSNTTTTKTVTRSTNNNTSNSNFSTTTKADVREIPPVVTVDQSSNDLAALSLAGSGGFMPSSVWQWLLVVLLILIIIIIARILSKPHGHDPHAVTAH